MPANPETKGNSILVNQDLQERQGNPSQPGPPHLWEGGRCSDKANESQNNWKGNGRSAECHESSFKSSILVCILNGILGNVEKCKPFQVCLHQFLTDSCWVIFLFPCRLLLLTGDCTRTPLVSTQVLSLLQLPTATSLFQVYIPHPPTIPISQVPQETPT